MNMIKQDAYILLQPLICEARRATVADAAIKVAMHGGVAAFLAGGDSCWCGLGRGRRPSVLGKKRKKPRETTQIVDFRLINRTGSGRADYLRSDRRGQESLPPTVQTAAKLFLDKTKPQPNRQGPLHWQGGINFLRIPFSFCRGRYSISRCSDRARKSTPRLKVVAASPISAMIPGKAESCPTAIVTYVLYSQLSSSQRNETQPEFAETAWIHWSMCCLV